MSRTVFCRKHQKDLEGLNFPPMPGARGQDIFENVSRQAWEEWQHEQTMLINEKHLSLMDPNTANTCRRRWSITSIMSLSTKLKVTYHRSNNIGLIKA